MNVFKQIYPPLIGIILFAVICRVIGVDFPIALAVYHDASSQWIPTQSSYDPLVNNV